MPIILARYILLLSLFGITFNLESYQNGFLLRRMAQGANVVILNKKIFFKKWLSALISVAFIISYIIRPNSWNTIYYKAIPPKYSDTTDRHRYSSPGYLLEPHTFFERGSNKYKQYRKGDTVPIFLNGKIVGEMNRSSVKLIWSRLGETDTLK